MKVRYAAMLFNKGIDRGLRIDDHSYISSADVSQILDSSRIEHWRSYIGTQTWSDLLACDSAFVFYEKNSKGEVNQDLKVKTNVAWYSLLLTDTPFSFYRTAFVVAGTGSLNDNNELENADINHYETMQTIVQPCYHESQSFTESLDSSGDDLGFKAENLRESYLLLESLQADVGVTSIVHDALESFRDARAHGMATTAIARFVESAEAVLAMPRGNCGKVEFSRRALKICSFQDQPYLGWTTETLLNEILPRLYRVRIARNHGKGTTDILSMEFNDSSDPTEEVCKLSYLSELLARRCIMTLLRHKDPTSLIKSRDQLEKAWGSDQFPHLTRHCLK